MYQPKRRQVAAGCARRTARSARRSVGKPGRRRRRGDGGAAGAAPSRCVDQQQAEVGERVAERGHLPVEDRGDPVVGRRSGRCRAGSRRARCRSPAVRAGRRRRAGRAARRCRAARGCGTRRAACPSGAPAGPGSPPAGRSRRARPRRGRPRAASARVSTRPSRDRPGALGAERRRARRPCRYGVPVDLLHDVERRAEHRPSSAHSSVGRRHRHGGVAQRDDHPVLAGHVVRGGQHVAQRRPAHDPRRACRRSPRR